MKSWYCKNNYDFWKWLEWLTIIAKGSIVDIYQGSAYASGSEYARFWLCQGPKYASSFWIFHGSEYTRVLNMPEFWIYQSSEYASVTQGSELAWIYLIMSEYAGIFFTFLHCSPLSNRTHIYFFLSKSTRNEKIESDRTLGCFFEDKKIGLFYSCRMYLIVL